jgi:hypothetical protein
MRNAGYADAKDLALRGRAAAACAFQLESHLIQ